MNKENRQYNIPRSIVHEVVIKSLSESRFLLNDSTILRNADIVGISIRKQNESGTKKTRNQNDIVSAVAFDKAFLTIRDGCNVDVIQSVPLEVFSVEGQNRQYSQVYLQQSFDPQQSFIEFADMSGITAGQAVEIVFYYCKRDVDNHRL
jgi:hypothetical protein